MTTIIKSLLIEISKAFARGEMAFAAPYFAADVKWNIIGQDPIIGIDEVLEVSKMLHLETFQLLP